jgi:undecaprenyl-diphosphatase
MPILHAIVLGITQGLSEFLPISSSGHLILVPWLFGWHDFAGSKSLEKSFDAILHLGTFLAAVAYFRHELVVYIRDGLKAAFNRRVRATPDGRLAWLIVLSALPAALVGAAGEKAVENHTGKIPLIAIMLIVFGLVLAWADRLGGRRELHDFSVRDALIAGGAQILALQPGVSRSGATITATRWLGFNRDSAARISFLMSIPVTGGAAVYKLAKVLNDGISSSFRAALIAGLIAATVSGFFAVWGLLKLVRTHSFTPFVIYRVTAGIVVLILAATVLN